MADANDKQHFFACKEEDLSDNEMLKIDLPDQPPVVVYKVGGNFFATDNTCTHGEASLAEGEVDDDFIIECPFHGGTFDIRTGEAIDFPCVLPLKSYPVTVEGGGVYVNLEEGKTPA
ncbi:non-heme iron oxygenase ferredoxin subunit [Marinobacter sp. SS13-12]|uniref:non-heme iron oxygenase ferredoxin subunit n=1 Tax=Marinobacter sp. SS13-12 TaxID=3050451 RepID=UPI002554D484|nr:non-heme iron oxygenase ferredoxin subunit [Marinobacter sp. SS13-12]MDK8465736.1 non-heme iron oxygenase ferredoxin subunit [Marinobacter sp. SS13-12]